MSPPSYDGTVRRPVRIARLDCCSTPPWLQMLVQHPDKRRYDFALAFAGRAFLRLTYWADAFCHRIGGLWNRPRAIILNGSTKRNIKRARSKAESAFLTSTVRTLFGPFR